MFCAVRKNKNCEHEKTTRKRDLGSIHDVITKTCINTPLILLTHVEDRFCNSAPPNDQKHLHRKPELSHSLINIEFNFFCCSHSSFFLCFCQVAAHIPHFSPYIRPLHLNFSQLCALSFNQLGSPYFIMFPSKHIGRKL